MRINNVTSATSKKTIIIMSVIVTFIIGGLILSYVFGAKSDLSLFGFFKWLFWMFQDLRADCEDDPLIPWFVLILPFCCFAGLIGAIVSRNNALKLYNIGLNVKYVDFLPDRLEFCFTKPEYNFVCAYSDIEKLDMNIKSQLVRTKNGSYIAFEQLDLFFSVLNDKTFELSNTPVSPMKTIYKIIDYAREVKEFKYCFSGCGEIPDMKEKIDKYLQTGYKDIVGKKGEQGMLLVSVMFFCIGLFMLTPFINDIIKDPIFLIMFFPLGLLVATPLVIDIILVIDKIRDSRYAAFHPQSDLGRKNFFDKITIWHVLIVKLIVLLILGYIFILPVVYEGIDKKIFNKPDNQLVQMSSYRVLDEKSDPKDSDSFVELKINPPSDYDYKSKNEIFDIRRSYVTKSVFKNDKYEVSQQVFGQIIDNKPWWGNVSCDILNYNGDYAYRIEGDSKLSTMINNPAILVGLYKLFLPWEDPYYGDYCTADYSKFLPESLKYNAKDNLFVVKYHVPPEFVKYKINVTGLSGGRNIPMQLSGLNALDFGYNYVYGYSSKNIDMLYPDASNVLSEIQIFKDFIHLGGSCQYEDGCNNLSPLQPGLIFNVQNLPAEIDLKLWKNKPSNKALRADAYFKIVFE